MGSISGVNLTSLLSSLGSSSSGIDVGSAVSAALAAMAAPEQNWINQQKTLQTQASGIDQIRNDVAALQDTLSALGDPVAALTSMTTTSSDPSIVTASAASGTATGSHVVIVDHIASAASAYSNYVATSSTPLTAGSFTLTVGTTATPIQIGNGVNTLDDLATYINGQNLGVTANVVNDASGSRIAIASNSTGTAAGFTITNAPGLTFTATAGQDAGLTVDGIPIDSASNTVTGAVSGLTLNLLGSAPGGQITVTVAPATSDIAQAFAKFVGAYNTVVNEVNAQYTLDGNQREGPLSGDSAVKMLQTNLLSMGSYSTGATGISNLADLGIRMGNDGTLTLDTTKLTNAIQNNFTAVKTFMQGTTSNGFVSSLNNQLNVLSDPVSGAFTVDLQSISNENKNLQEHIDSFQAYLNAQKILLTAEYSQADITLQQLPKMQAQIDAMLGNNSSSKS